MASFIGGIINITIGAVILASVFITTVKGQNTSGWSASEVAMWGLLSLVGINQERKVLVALSRARIRCFTSFRTCIKTFVAITSTGSTHPEAYLRGYFTP